MSNTVNKPELVGRIAEELGESKALVGRVLEAFENTVLSEVKEGNEVKISGFLAFDRVTASARIARNPKTGEEIKVPERQKARVRALSKFKKLFD